MCAKTWKNLLLMSKHTWKSLGKTCDGAALQPVDYKLHVLRLRKSLESIGFKAVRRQVFHKFLRRSCRISTSFFPEFVREVPTSGEVFAQYVSQIFLQPPQNVSELSRTSFGISKRFPTVVPLFSPQIVPQPTTFPHISASTGFCQQIFPHQRTVPPFFRTQKIVPQILPHQDTSLIYISLV